MDLISRPQGFNCVHLPIVYTLSNDKFPVNTLDSIVTVSSQSNEYGYTYLTLSGDLKIGVQTLDYLTLEVNGVSGIYQIIKVVNDSQVVINLQFNSANSFGNCQYYYNNYHNKIRIFAGLRIGHDQEMNKEMRLITDINVIPDTNNYSIININEFLKTDIKILSNNSASQNAINQFTEFYIVYAESYDSSDGNIISSYISPYTNDSSNYAIAVNSKLPFQNGYGGAMDAYTTGQFLTLMNTPVLFPGYEYYIWCLRELSDTSDLTVERYKNGTLQGTDTFTINQQDEGVYSLKLSDAYPVGDEDQLQIYTDAEVKTIDINRNCSNQSIYLTWLNYLGGMDSWVFTAQKDYGVDIEDVQETENNIFINWPNSYSDSAIKYQIKRQSRETILVRSQNLTLDQVNGLKYIKTSPLVQTYDNLYKNVLVDNSSFTVYSESDKLYSISFTISMTDQVPSQSL